MASESQKKAYKNYNNKSIQLSVCYRPSEIDEGKRIKSYLDEHNLSANAYIKDLIKKNLDSKGYYIDD